MSRPSPAAVERQLADAIAEHRKGKLKPAARLYRAVIAADPRNVAALEMFGMLLAQEKQYPEAERHLRAALSMSPDSLPAKYNLANTLRLQSRYEEAAPLLEAVAEAMPDRAEVQVNLGVTLFELERLNDAMRAFGRAADLDPSSVAALFNLGRSAQLSARLPIALSALQAAAKLAPGDGDVLDALAKALAANGDVAQAKTVHERRVATAGEPPFERTMAYAHNCARLCDWDNAERVRDAALKRVAVGGSGVEPFALLSLLDDPAVHRSAAELWSRQYDRRAPVPRPAARPSPERLRIAYVSGDFASHPLSLLMAGVFERHDRARFEIIGLSTGPDDGSAIGKRVRDAFDVLEDVSMWPVARIVEYARVRQIDIAVNLTGYTDYARSGAFASRLAGVQVGYLGYPSTMGATWMDYVLADPVVAPDHALAHFTEAVARLPHCFQANDDKAFQPKEAPPRHSLGLPQDAVVLASFNNSYKINRQMFGAWMSILRAVPDAVLWLFAPSQSMSDALRQAAVERGVDPQRVVFAGFQPFEAHLARQLQADLFLDTVPYNAGATASAALWCGLPVLTIAGQSMPARMGASLLTAVDLPDMIAPDLPAYIDRAIALASDPAALSAVRSRLAKNLRTSKLFDTDLFTRHLEDAYVQMHARHAAGEQPCSFDVPPRS